MLFYIVYCVCLCLLDRGGKQRMNRERERYVGCRDTSLVTQSCWFFCYPMDCSQPDSTVRGILQARILEWVAISSSRASSQTRDWIWISCNSCRFFTTVLCGKPILSVGWKWKWKSPSPFRHFFLPQGLYSPWSSPGQNTWVGRLSLLQGIFPTQVSYTAGGFFIEAQRKPNNTGVGSLSLLQWIFPTE